MGNHECAFPFHGIKGDDVICGPCVCGALPPEFPKGERCDFCLNAPDFYCIQCESRDIQASVNL